MALNKHQIFAAKDWNPIAVEVPEWGGSVLVKVMSVREGIEFQEQRLDPKYQDKIVPLLVSKTVCDEEGKPTFTLDDLEELCEKNPVVLAKVFNVALVHNDLGVKDEQPVEQPDEKTTEAIVEANNAKN